MRRLLILFFVLVLALMTWATVAASLDRSVLEAGRALWPDLWFRATLADTYCAFLTFFLWVAYKETGWLARIGWLLGILLLGNFAIATYMLRALWQLPAEAPLSQLLLRRG